MSLILVKCSIASISKRILQAHSSMKTDITKKKKRIPSLYDDNDEVREACRGH